jgi:hypothetical protein
LAAGEVTRSFGRERKFDVSAGFEIDRRFHQHAPPPGTAPSAEADFSAEWLPVDDTQIGPVIRVRSFEERYLRTVELDTLGLQEDFRLGPEFLVQLGATSADAGSTRSLVSVGTYAGYTLALGDGLVRALAGNTYDYATNGEHDAVCAANVRIASPRFALGRVIADSAFRSRYRNHLNLRYGLGGDTRLRGYPTSGFQKSFSGATYFAANLEFRTRSVDILTAQSGLAAFYDVGHAARTFRELVPHQSVGLGVRILFPQADRTVFRADWSFPLNPVAGERTLPGAFFVTFGQAFGTPELDSGSLANPETYLATVPR